MVYPSKFGKVLIVISLLSLASLCTVYTASTQDVTVRAEASSAEPHVGDTLTVNIKVSNAQDLYGVDLTVDWNPQVLKVLSATPTLGVESHPDGILHESTDYPADIEENTLTAGQYHLLATSTGSSTPSFSGSGTIATLTFNVTGTGATGLALSVELSTRGSDGAVSLVEPSTSVDTVNVVVPEFPAVSLIVVLLVAATATALLATRLGSGKVVAPRALEGSR